jgi:hypothetical protein
VAGFIRKDFGRGGRKGSAISPQHGDLRETKAAMRDAQSVVKQRIAERGPQDFYFALAAAGKHDPTKIPPNSTRLKAKDVCALVRFPASNRTKMLHVKPFGTICGSHISHARWLYPSIEPIVTGEHF